MPADGTKAAHLANGNLGMSRLEQLLETIQHVLVCKEGDGLPFSEMAQMRPLRCPLCRGSRSKADVTWTPGIDPDDPKPTLGTAHTITSAYAD